MGVFIDFVEFGKEVFFKNVCRDSRGSGRRFGSNGSSGGDRFNGFFSGFGGFSFGFSSGSGGGGFFGIEKRDEYGFKGGFNFCGVGLFDVNVSKVYDIYG